MQESRSSYRKSFIISLLLHVVVLGVLVLNFEFSSAHYVLKNNSQEPTIQATVLNSLPLPKPITPPEPPKIVPQASLPPKPIAPPPLKPLPLPKVVAQPKPIAISPKKDEIALKIKKQKEHQKALLQKQLLTDLKKHTEDRQKQKKQEALQQAFENEMRNLSKKSLQQATSEKLPMSQSQLDKMHGIVDKYRALILEAVGRRWLIPGGADKTSSTKLLIRLDPGGLVRDVQVAESSGNPALDSSARTAVFKASPLPVPNEADEFKPFQQFVMVFRPMMFQNGG